MDEIRVFGLGITATTFSPPRYDGWSRLLTCPRGACVVRTATGVTSLFAGRGLSLDEEPIEITVRERADIRVLYRWDRPAQRTRYVRITPLLSALIDRFVERGYIDPSVEADRDLLRVTANECDALVAENLPLTLIGVNDPLARQAVTYWTALPVLSLGETARALGCSVRTLNRAFAREGATAAAWRRRCSILIAIAAIASGATVASAGCDAGFSTASSFIDACRREFGRTPLSLVRRDR